MMMMKKTALAAAILSMMLGAGAQAEVPEYDLLELQARSNLIVNDNGFNVPPGTSFNNISAVINDEQQVTFSAGVVPIDGDLSRSGGGLWLGGHGAGEFVAIHEPPAGDPNDPPTMIVADRPGINIHGVVAYYTSVDGGPYTMRRYDPISGVSSPVSLLPLTPSSLGNVAIDDGGYIAFKGRMGSGYAIAAQTPTGNVLYAVDTNIDGASPYAYIYSPASNNSGRIASKVSTSDYNHNEIRLFSADGNSTRVVADDVSEPGSPYRKFDNSLAYNDYEAVAVTVNLLEGNVRAVMRFTPNTTGGYDATEIARVDPAGTIRDIESFAPALSNNGVVVFRAKDADGQAIYAGDGETLRRIAGQGDVVLTDQGPGQIGQHDSSPIFSGAPTINTRGDIAFVAGLHPEGNNQAEWGSGVIVAYAVADPIDDGDRIFADDFELHPKVN